MRAVLLALAATTLVPQGATAQDASPTSFPRPGTPARAALDAEWRRGTLDAVALMRRIAGPLPLPESARVVRCASTPDHLAFTLDRRPSIQFMRYLYAMQIEATLPVDAVDKARGNPRPLAKTFGQIKEVVAGEGLPAHALLRRLRAGIEAAGYVRDLEVEPAVGYRHPRQVPFRTLLIGVSMQAHDEQQRCAAVGEAITAGPMIRLRYATRAPLGPMELMELTADRLNAGLAQMGRDVDMMGDD